MSLIDVLVGSAITLIIFVALFGLLRASFTVSSLTKSKAIATTIAAAQLELVRSLEYDDVGTVGGIPNGAIEQTATSTHNGLTFVTRTFIRYIDDPSDGLGASDETGIITDYKQVKVTVSYTINNQERSVELISNQSPVGLETTVGGGTLQVNVVNAVGVAIAGAEVHIQNSSLTPAVDLTTFTNAAGLVFLPGAATSTDYRITVTKDGYSTAQTYARDTTNQNPTPGYLTVAENQTTSATFAIDLLADLTIRTLTPPETSTWEDSFDDASNIASASNAGASGGAIKLIDSGAGYPGSGSVVSVTLTPSGLAQWLALDADLNPSASTQVSVQVVNASGTLLPDDVLPGNSTGFTSFPVSLAGVATSTYPALALRAVLESSAPAETPDLTRWSLSYETNATPIPNVSHTLRGAKTVGSTGAGAAIYKTTVSDTTGASGATTHSLEWDAYDLTLNGYDIVDACSSPPYALSPGVTIDSSLYLGTDSAHMLLVTVKDTAGAVVAGADVTLSRTGYSETVQTSSCGTAYFGDLAAGSAYTISLSKAGYSDTSFTGVSVSGNTFYVAPFE